MRTSPSLLPRRSTVWLLFLMLASAAASLSQWSVLAPSMSSRSSDYAPVRMGTQAVWKGIDPYSDATTREIQIFYYGRSLNPGEGANNMGFAYPLYTALLLAPFGMMPWESFCMLFLITVPLLLGLSVPLWIDILRLDVSKGRTAILSILFVASWQTVWAIRLQQVTPLVMLLMVAGCCLLQRGWDGSAGVLLAMTTIKPQLAAPLLLWLLLWAIAKRRVRFVVTGAAAFAVLLGSSLWMQPDWIPRWFDSMRDYARYTHVQPLLQIYLGRWPGGIAVCGIVAASALLLWRLRCCKVGSREFGRAVAFTLAATIAVNPSDPAMIYNQVFLLPACLALLDFVPPGRYARFVRGAAIKLIGLSYLLTIAGALGERLGSNPELWFGLSYRTSFLPLMATAGLGLGIWELLPGFAFSETERTAVTNATA